MFQRVEYQFAPNKYGSYKNDNDHEKWNILVVSIEAFLDAAKSSLVKDEGVLVNITMEDPAELDIQREGRQPNEEENINRAILKSLFCSDHALSFNGQYIKYVELPYSELKQIRDDKEALMKYFDNICP